MQFDLFQLHDDKQRNNPLKWISASGTNLHQIIHQITDEIIEAKAEKVIAHKLNPKDMKKLLDEAYLKIPKQLDLAKALGVPRQLLYRWETGLRRITEQDLNRLVEIANLQKPVPFDTKTHLNYMNLQVLSKELAQRLHISLNGPERVFYENRPFIPLIFIKELLLIWHELSVKNGAEYALMKEKVLRAIDFLQQNHPAAQKIIAVRELTPSLAKIVGAIIADGAVVRRSNSICMVDGHYQNLVRFSEWIKEIFGLKCKIHSKGRIHRIKIDNRVIYGYLTVFFDFVPGVKDINHDIPDIIKEAGFDIQKSCALGIMSFDGVVRTNSEIGINIKSKNLRDSLFNIFQKDGLNVHKSGYKDKTGMWKLYSSRNFENKIQFRKWQEYFAEQTPKWFKINSWIYGYSKKVKSSDEAFIIFDKYFPATGNSRLTLSELTNLVLNKKYITVAELMKYKERQGRKIAIGTAWFYLTKLKDMKILNKVQHFDHSITYELNPIEEWCLPSFEIAK